MMTRLTRVELYDQVGLVESRGGLRTPEELADAVKRVKQTAEATPNVHTIRVCADDELLAAFTQQTDRDWTSIFIAPSSRWR